MKTMEDINFIEPEVSSKGAVVGMVYQNDQKPEKPTRPPKEPVTIPPNEPEIPVKPDDPTVLPDEPAVRPFPPEGPEPHPEEIPSE